MSRVLDTSTKKTWQLVLFSYGDPEDPAQAAFTNWTASIDGPPTFQSLPAMEVKLPENVGTLENKELEIRMPRGTFVDRLSSGVAHSPCFVQVWENLESADVDGTDLSDELTVFSGRVITTVRHPEGKRNIVEIRAISPKGELEVPLGLQANHLCNWTLGKSPCGASPIIRTSLEVANLSGRLLTVSAMSTSGLSDRHFHRGFVLLDGLRIAIREWRLASPLDFYLVRPAPLEWLGESIDAYTGCPKTIEACRALYDSEETFMGLGYAIPPYNPIIEDGSE